MPRNVVRTQGFACIDPAEGSPHAVRGQRHHRVAGRRWSLTFTFIHLADASIQSDLQLRNTISDTL